MSYLIKPPQLGQFPNEQQSVRISHQSRQDSSKSQSKKKNKQTCIAIHKNNHQKTNTQNSNHYDNASIKSHQSNNSSKSKKKQTTLKIHQQPSNRNHIAQYQNQQQLSQIKQYVNPKDSSSQKKQKKYKLSKLSPYSQFTDKDSQEQIPIYQIKQTDEVKGNNKHYNVIVNMPINKSQLMMDNWTDQKKQEKEHKRGKIFPNQNYNSKTIISNDNSQLNRSLNKSKSKLGTLLKQSRDKKIIEQSKMNSNLQIQSMDSLRQQSKIASKHSPPSIVKIQYKQAVDDSKFDINQSSDLDLSQSHHAAKNQNKQSVHFIFQKQKRKGITLSSKQLPKMVQIEGDIISKRIQKSNQPIDTTKLVNNAELQKQQHNKLINQLSKNEQFLYGKERLTKIQNQKEKIQVKPEKNYKNIQFINKIQNSQLTNKMNKNLENNNIMPNNYWIQPNYVEIKQNNKIEEQIQEKINQQKQKEKFHKQKHKQKDKEKQKQKQTYKFSQINVIPTTKQKESLPYNSLNNATSTFSKELSSGSSRSNSKSIEKKKKQTTINTKKSSKMSKIVLTPRQQESFYQEQRSPQKNKQFIVEQPKKNVSKKVQQKKPKIISFSQSEEDVHQNVKSQTDIQFYQNQGRDNFPKLQTESNFYNNDIEKSRMKPPSSKPPLSRKSVASSSSNSKSKVKETSLKNNKVNTIKIKQQPKKLSLLQIAMKSKHSNESYSPPTYSRQSKNSKVSSNSRKSLKKQGVIKLKENILSGNKTPIKEYFYEPQKEKKNQIIQNRKIVCKDVTVLNQRGQLVKKDVVIEGNKIYNIPSERSLLQEQSIYQQSYKRLKGMRNRSRSKSRGQKRNRSRSQQRSYNQSNGLQLKSKNSTSSYDQSSLDQSLYSYHQKDTNLTLRQFMKPIEDFIPPSAQKLRQQFYDEHQQNKPTTLNDLFYRQKQTHGKKRQKSAHKKTMPRTQKVNIQKQSKEKKYYD